MSNFSPQLLFEGSLNYLERSCGQGSCSLMLALTGLLRIMQEGSIGDRVYHRCGRGPVEWMEYTTKPSRISVDRSFRAVAEASGGSVVLEAMGLTGTPHDGVLTCTIELDKGATTRTLEERLWHCLECTRVQVLLALRHRRSSDGVAAPIPIQLAVAIVDELMRDAAGVLRAAHLQLKEVDYDPEDLYD